MPHYISLLLLITMPMLKKAVLIIPFYRYPPTWISPSIFTRKSCAPSLYDFSNISTLLNKGDGGGCHYNFFFLLHEINLCVD